MPSYNRYIHNVSVFIHPGFNPYWDCSMSFTIHLHDLALIRFSVFDEDPIGRDFIGQVSMPVRSLIPGKLIVTGNLQYVNDNSTLEP